MWFLIFFFLVLTLCILTNSGLSLHYALLGLNLWFQKMVPALLPFMILSGVMVRLHLTEKIAMVIYPLVSPLWRVRKNVVYCMMLGFLCGFPMGARVTADLYERKGLSAREAEYLLAFCNNIGPVYFCSFVLPLLDRKLTAPYLFGMYGIPLLYGLLLRYTLFRDLDRPESSVAGRPVTKHPAAELSAAGLCCRETPVGLFGALDDAIAVSAKSILSLGGYMILFNLMNVLPRILLRREPAVIAPLLEITGGLSMLGGRLPLYSLLALSFGGLSCMAQTYSCIGETGLPLSSYVNHKIVLTLLTVLFYLGWFLLAPASFLL